MSQSNLKSEGNPKPSNNFAPVYTRINYTYGQSSPPIFFTSLEEAQKQIPSDGSAIFEHSTIGVRAEVKYYFSHYDMKWHRGRVTG